MLNKIKALADEAIALQNKSRMDEVLREISVLCDVKEPLSNKSMVDEFDKIPAGSKIAQTKKKGAKDAE